MTIDGKKWGRAPTPITSGASINKDAYKAAGVEVPGPEGVNWETFIANCEKFKAANIERLTTGTKALWPGAGIFDYMSLRTNGEGTWT